MIIPDNTIRRPAGAGRFPVNRFCISAFTALFIVAFPVASRAVQDTSYTNWPNTPQWVDLTNNLFQCYTGLVMRCLAINSTDYRIPLHDGLTGLLDGFDPPSYIYPMDDYMRFVAKIDQIAPYFVCQTNTFTDPDGTFNEWFAENINPDPYDDPIYRDVFPRWYGRYHTSSNLLEYCAITNSCGQTNWFTDVPLHSWQIVNHSIQTQVVDAINTLQWTCKEDTGQNVLWVDVVWRHGDNMVDKPSSYSTATASAQAHDLLYSTSDGKPSDGWTTGQWTDDTPDYYDAHLDWVRTKPALNNLYTNVERSVAFYLKAIAIEGVYNNFGETHIDEDVFHESSTSIISHAICSTSTIAIGPVTMPAAWSTPGPGDSFVGQGYNIDTSVPLIKWLFPVISQPVFTNNVADAPDLDRDDIVDIGADVESFGPDTGTIVFRADQDLPYVVLPLASPPIWYGGLFTHACISQGGFTNLPYSYLIPDMHDKDGHYTAYSLYARVLESGTNHVVSPITPIKRVSLMRPRGELVEFDFQWHNSSQSFTNIGLPIGVNSNRTYVLHDVTDTSDTDLKYDLYFDSGIIHRFGSDGYLTSVSNADTRTASVSIADSSGTSTLPWGSSIVLSYGQFLYSSLFSGDSRYLIVPGEGGWGCTVVTQLVYHARDNYLNMITNNLTKNPDGWITGMSKSGAGIDGIADANATITSKNLITYPWSGVTRSQTAPAGNIRTVTLTTQIADSGSVVEEVQLNAGDRVTEYNLAANDDEDTTTYQYGNGTGRSQANGHLKSSKVTHVGYSDGTEATYSYDPDTGWLVSSTLPFDGIYTRSIAYSYAKNALGGDDPVTNNLVERPRQITTTVGGNVVEKTLYGYYGMSSTKIQQFTNATDGITTENSYVTSQDLLYGLLDLSTYPSGQSDYSHSVEGVSGGGFTALGKLQTIGTHPGNETVTNKVNAFGNVEVLTTVRSAENTTYSASSTIDSFGRPVETDFNDGTSETRSNYNLHGPQTITERDGSTTTIGYNHLGWVTSVNNSQLGRGSTYAHDALGNQTEDEETATGMSPITTKTAYDASSRPISVTDLLGTKTYSHNGTTVTITPPGDSGTITEEHFPDGSLKAISGTGAAEQFENSYEFDGNSLCVKQTKTGTSRWTKNTLNMLGNPSKTRRNGITGQALFYYDSAARPSKTVDETGAVNLRTYTSENRLNNSGSDVDKDDTLDIGESDRFSTYVQLSSVAGIKNRTWQYTVIGSSTSNLLYETETSLDGKRTTSIHLDSRTNVTVRGAFTGAGAYTVTTTNSDGTRVESVYSKWLLTQVKKYEKNGIMGESTTYGHDGFGAVTSIVSTIGGTTTVTRIELDECRRVARRISTEPDAPLVEYKYWPGTYRVMRERKPDGRLVWYDYYPNGLLKREFGDVSDISYEYNTSGEKTKMTMWTNSLAGNVTEWIYSDTTGWLTQKEVNDVAVESYTYRDNGQVLTMTDAVGNMRSNTYSEAGDLAAVSWTNASLQLVYTNIDRLGRIGMKIAGALTNCYSYNLDGTLCVITNKGGLIPESVLAYNYRSYDGALTGLNYTVAGEARNLALAYDDWNRISAVTDGTVSVSYGYLTNSTFANSQTITTNGLTALTKTVQWDVTNSRPIKISWVGGVATNSFTYQYAPNSDRINRITLADGTYWRYEYDSKGQLISGKRYNSNGSEYLGMQFGYAYDQAGNVTNAGSITVENKPLLVFTNDAFNMQIARVWSNKVELIGTASTNATVTVNDQPCDRQGEKFKCWLTLTNLTDSFQTNVIVYAASNNIVASNVGTLFVAKPTEIVSNSVAGYPLQDSRYALSWDGWDRLTSMESTNANPNFRLQFTYFADGQRASKVVYTNANGTWIGHSTNVYTYDGWNLISETQVSGLTSQVLHYVWSLDLAGQKDGKWGQGAGGIGGLISIAVSDGGAVTNTYFPLSDHQGTVHGLRNGSGQLVAQYFYTPYGAVIGESGAARDVCPFRFQSQYLDKETGIYQWKRRYYDAVLCRWLSRDPLAEQADPNLFRFCGGDPVGRIDAFGEAWKTTKQWDATTFAEVKREFVATAIDLEKQKTEKFDCADAALTALIRAVQAKGLPLRFKYWSPTAGDWAYYDQADFATVAEFEQTVRHNLGAINLFENTTQVADYNDIEAGDLFIYDLRHHSHYVRRIYQGHTMIVAEVKQNQLAKGKTIRVFDVIEGHTTTTPGEGTVLDRKNYTEVQIKSKFPQTVFPETPPTGEPGLRHYLGAKEKYRMIEAGGREWAWRIFKDAKTVN